MSNNQNQGQNQTQGQEKATEQKARKGIRLGDTDSKEQDILDREKKIIEREKSAFGEIVAMIEDPESYFDFVNLKDERGSIPDISASFRWGSTIDGKPIGTNRRKFATEFDVEVTNDSAPKVKLTFGVKLDEAHTGEPRKVNIIKIKHLSETKTREYVVKDLPADHRLVVKLEEFSLTLTKAVRVNLLEEEINQRENALNLVS